MAARLTPDQKVIRSNRVSVKSHLFEVALDVASHSSIFFGCSDRSGRGSKPLSFSPASSNNSNRSDGSRSYTAQICFKGVMLVAYTTSPLPSLANYLRYRQGSSTKQLSASPPGKP